MSNRIKPSRYAADRHTYAASGVTPEEEPVQSYYGFDAADGWMGPEVFLPEHPARARIDALQTHAGSIMNLERGLRLAYERSGEIFPSDAEIRDACDAVKAMDPAERARYSPGDELEAIQRLEFAMENAQFAMQQAPAEDSFASAVQRQQNQAYAATRGSRAQLLASGAKGPLEKVMAETPLPYGWDR